MNPSSRGDDKSNSRLNYWEWIMVYTIILYVKYYVQTALKLTPNLTKFSQLDPNIYFQFRQIRWDRGMYLYAQEWKWTGTA